MAGNDDIRTFYQGTMRFTLAPRFIVVTTPIQRFYLLPTHSSWHRKYNNLRKTIELGEVRDIYELLAWTRAGIEIRSTQLTEEQLVGQ